MEKTWINIAINIIIRYCLRRIKLFFVNDFHMGPMANYGPIFKKGYTIISGHI